MLYLFDLDGTLITSYMDNPDRAFHAWQPLPGRFEKVVRLMRFADVALISNQGGVAFGLITEQDVVKKFGRVAMLLGCAALALHDGRSDGPLVAGYGPALDAHVCYSDARAKDARYRTPADVARRKPNAAMLREAIALHAGMADDGVLFIGDRPEDEAAARDAGVRFQWADDFFRR